MNFQLTKPIAAVLLLALVAGCSKRELETAPRLNLQDGVLAAHDSVPHPPHPSPPPDTLFTPVRFLGADSTLAGTTGISRWLLGNPGRKPYTVEWTLTNFEGWPGYPIQGSLRIRGQDDVLEVPTPVPATALTGAYTIALTVSTGGGNTWTEFGTIRVYGNDPPPPPPPPPPAVLFAGSDSVAAGQTASTRWQLANESDQPFTMNWTLSGQNWPSLPKQGAVDLQPLEQRLIEVQVAVPDTTGPGYHPIEMVVIRPNGQPASSPGAIFVVP